MKNNIKPVIFCLIVFFFSCKKSGTFSHALQQVAPIASVLAPPNGETVESYIVLSVSKTIQGGSTDYINDIVGMANFSDNDISQNVGTLSINNQVIAPDQFNSYRFDYNTPTAMQEGLQYPASNINISISGGSGFPAFQKIIYVPREIILNNLDIPYGSLNRNLPLTLQWQRDAFNLTGKVSISVDYYKGLSKIGNPNMPNAIASTNYLIGDIGSFTIPASDFAKYPAGCYIGISVTRAVEQFVDITKTDNNAPKRIFLYTVVNSKTTPLFVRN